MDGKATAPSAVRNFFDDTYMTHREAVADHYLKVVTRGW
jgi:hypothetical protein